jgi:hypothetical protein
MKKNIITIEGRVSEMSQSFDEGVNVPIPADVKLDELTDGDESPMFVTVEAVNEGKSANKRFYDQDVIMEIARQVNEKRPDAYLGHLADEDRNTKRPEPQTIWLGSVVKKMDGKLRLFVKGYVLPNAKQLRSYLKKAKASGKNVAVSVYGQAKQTWDEAITAYKLSEFNLESIDWVRSGSEGITPASAFQITSEMKNVASREETIRQMSVAELKAINPALVKAIKSEVEVETITEMDEGLNKELTNIREMVGDDPIESIRSLQMTVAEQKIDSSLQSKITDVTTRKLVKRMILQQLKSFKPEVVAESIQQVLQTREVVDIIGATGNSKINPLKDNRKKKGQTRKFTKTS